MGAHGGITQEHWEHWGSPDLPTAVRQGAPGAAAAPFLPPPAPRLSPFPVSGLLLFWVRGQGRAGPAAGNSPARAGAAPGTAEPPRAQPRHRGPATGVPNTPGTARPARRPAQPRGIPVGPGCHRPGDGADRALRLGGRSRPRSGHAASFRASSPAHPPRHPPPGPARGPGQEPAQFLQRLRLPLQLCGAGERTLQAPRDPTPHPELCTPSLGSTSPP